MMQMWRGLDTVAAVARMRARWLSLSFRCLHVRNYNNNNNVVILMVNNNNRQNFLPLQKREISAFFFFVKRVEEGHS